MLKNMRNIYLLRREIYGEPKEITKDEFWELSEIERYLVEPQVEDGVYTIKTPKEVTSEEMAEIISIQISEDISKIKKCLKEIEFIMKFCFISSIVVVVFILLAYMF